MVKSLGCVWFQLFMHDLNPPCTAPAFWEQARPVIQGVLAYTAVAPSGEDCASCSVACQPLRTQSACTTMSRRRYSTLEAAAKDPRWGKCYFAGYIELMESMVFAATFWRSSTLPPRGAAQA